jgi:hypothetical protein
LPKVRKPLATAFGINEKKSLKMAFTEFNTLADNQLAEMQEGLTPRY